MCSLHKREKGEWREGAGWFVCEEERESDGGREGEWGRSEMKAERCARAQQKWG